MPGESWIDRQRRAVEQDPQEQAIQEMFRNVEEVTAPERIVPVRDVPEFNDDASAKGIVAKVVHQGQMGSTEHLPIRSDNASVCNIFVIKTPGEGKPDRFTMVHVWSGELDLNLNGSRRKDIATLANDKSTAIGITGGRSTAYGVTAREFKYEGITTTKHIDVPSGNRYVSAVFRPETNDILVMVGSDEDATEVWEYGGF